MLILSITIKKVNKANIFVYGFIATLYILVFNTLNIIFANYTKLLQQLVLQAKLLL